MIPQHLVTLFQACKQQTTKIFLREGLQEKCMEGRGLDKFEERGLPSVVAGVVTLVQEEAQLGSHRSDDVTLF